MEMDATVNFGEKRPLDAIATKSVYRPDMTIRLLRSEDCVKTRVLVLSEEFQELVRDPES